MNPSGPSRRHVLGAADPATRLLETAPNVGPRTAETFAARLHDPRVRGIGIWKVRMNLDDFAAIRIHEYQRVRLKLPLEDEMYVYFRGRRENPSFVWLEFGFDVRRRLAHHLAC